MSHRDRDTGRKWISGAAKRQKNKQLSAEIKKMIPLTSFFAASAQSDKDVEASVSATTPEMIVSDSAAENLSDVSSQESSTSSVSSVTDSGPEFNIEQQQASSDSITLLSDDPALWPESVSEQERVALITKGPTQVKDFAFSADETGRKFNIGCYIRHLGNGEKVTRSWLVYSIENNAVFCFCCKLFSNRKILLSSAEGCSDWKNIGQKLKEHDTSSDHVNCMQAWRTLAVHLNANATIDSSHQRLIENEKKHWRSVLERLFAIVQMLAERSLAFRGHREELYEPNNGNFLTQVELLAKFDPIMSEHLRRIKDKECFDTYLGKDIQNEMIGLISNKILKVIVSSLKAAKYFSVIMDCTPDTSHKEQLSIVLRCVEIKQKEVKIKEYFCGFLHITDSTGSGLVGVFLEFLDKNDLDLQNCRGQSYDNGANMRGQYKGVQALIKERNSRAFYVPCANHTFNLMVCDAAKSTTSAINFFGTVQRVFTFFAASTVRWEILQSTCKATLKSLSDTRWESRINSIKALKNNLLEICQALQKVADSSAVSLAVSEANSLASEISSYQFILSLIIWHDILFQINKVSKLMQNPSADVTVMIKLVDATKHFFQKFRSDETFEALMQSAEEIALKLGTDPTFPQVRVRQKRRLFDYEGVDAPLSGRAKFKIEFFNAIIDVAAASLNERFEMLDSYSAKFDFLTCTEKLHTLAGANELRHACTHLETVLRGQNMEESDVNAEELYTEIITFLRMEAEKSMTAFEILQYITANSLIEIFPNFFIALRILLTLPVSVASAERSFSKLKLIKTYLRSKISQDRFTGLALISIENELGRDLDYSDLIEEFASVKARKVKL